MFYIKNHNLLTRSKFWLQNFVKDITHMNEFIHQHVIPSNRLEFMESLLHLVKIKLA